MAYLVRGAPLRSTWAGELLRLQTWYCYAALRRNLGYIMGLVTKVVEAPTFFNTTALLEIVAAAYYGKPNTLRCCQLPTGHPVLRYTQQNAQGYAQRH